MLKIEDLEKLRVADKRRSAEIIAQRDAVIKKRNEWILANHEYDEELMPDLKKTLDSDIREYRRMIEAEEGRYGNYKLNI